MFCLLGSCRCSSRRFRTARGGRCVDAVQNASGCPYDPVTLAVRALLSFRRLRLSYHPMSAQNCVYQDGGYYAGGDCLVWMGMSFICLKVRVGRLIQHAAARVAARGPPVCRPWNGKCH